MKILLPFLICLVILTGCEENRIYKDYERIEGNVWNQTNQVVFTPEIESASNEYQTYLAIRHGNQFPADYVDVRVTVKPPDGIKFEENYRVHLKNADGSWSGEGMAEQWDNQLEIMQGYAYEAGEYTFTVEQVMADQLPLIVSVGLKIFEKEQAD